MKVFLTGGTGYIGQPLAKFLLARGWSVVALVRNPDSPRSQALAEMGARCVTGDVTQRESMRLAMEGSDIVIHNAAWYELGITRQIRPLMHATNVTGTGNVLDLALGLGIPRTVHISSTFYYGDSGTEERDEHYCRQKPFKSFYEQTKAEAHVLALDYIQRGLPLIIVCPTNVLGPNDHSAWGYFIRLYLNRLQPPFAWAPEAINSGVYVNDAAAGITLAAEKGRPGETYILAGDSISLREVVEIWNTKPGGFKTRFYIPLWLARLLFAALEPLQRMAGLPAFISHETAASGGMNFYFSSAKAQRELGWSYRPANEMWQDILDEEIKLIARRRKRDLVSRLNPMEPGERG